MSSIGTTSDWIGCATPSPLCFTILIDTLYKHGFCCSYPEVQKFEQNAVLSYGTDIPNYSSEFVQYVADNAGHNIATLDRKETFHGMGMIAAITPGTKKSTKFSERKLHLGTLLLLEECLSNFTVEIVSA